MAARLWLRTNNERFAIDQSGTAMRVIIFFPALARVSMRFTEANGAGILGIHVKPDRTRAFVVHRTRNVAKQLVADSVAAHRGQDLDGLDIGDDLPVCSSVVSDRKPRHLAGFFCDP